MKIGVQLPEVEREVSWDEMRDIALAADEGGLDSIWLGDHLLYRSRLMGSKGPMETWSLLAGLAEATSTVLLGPLVACTAFYSPAMLAKKAATVDEMSGGRLVLGLGAGWNRVEFEAFGYPFDHRVSRFEEAFTIIRTLIREGIVDFDGEFHTMRDMELIPRARAEMPLMIGSNGPRMLRIATPHVDMWNSWFLDYENDPANLPALSAAVDDACLSVGRAPAEIERTVAVHISLADRTGRTAAKDEIHRAEPISGSREQIAIRLRHFEPHVSHVQVVLHPIDVHSVVELAEIARLV